MIQEFNCAITKFKINYEIEIEYKYAIISFPNYFEIVNESNYKAFFLLLRGSIESMKKKNIKKIRQYVTNQDWLDVMKNKTSWKIVDICNFEGIPYLVVECDINDALENIGKCFGIDYILKI